MNRFLTDFGFVRIDQTTWRWKDSTVDLCVVKEMIGAVEFVSLFDGPQNITYWQATTLGLNWDEFASQIRNAEQRQRG